MVPPNREPGIPECHPDSGNGPFGPDPHGAGITAEAYRGRACTTNRAAIDAGRRRRQAFDMGQPEPGKLVLVVLPCPTLEARPKRVVRRRRAARFGCGPFRAYGEAPGAVSHFRTGSSYHIQASVAAPRWLVGRSGWAARALIVGASREACLPHADAFSVASVSCPTGATVLTGASRSHALAVGQRPGQYEIFDVLAVGAVGIEYAALDREVSK